MNEYIIDYTGIEEYERMVAKKEYVDNGKLVPILLGFIILLALFSAMIGTPVMNKIAALSVFWLFIILIIWIIIFFKITEKAEKLCPCNYQLNIYNIERKERGFVYKGYELKYNYDLITIYFNDKEFNVSLKNLYKRYDFETKLEYIERLLTSLDDKNNMHFRCSERAYKDFRNDIAYEKEQKLKLHWN